MKIRNLNHVRSRSKIITLSGLVIALLLMVLPCVSARSADLSTKESTQAEGRTITGVVKDVTGEPLIGVSVSIKGTTIGTLTDMDGNYSIKIQNENNVLVFSYIGFIPHEITVGNKKEIPVTLKEDTQNLDEVIVVGYGVQKKKLVTGATLQVKGDDLQKLSTTSALEALQSQAPGVNITQTSGMPGEGFKVNIRGLGTVGDAAPLYVIDNIPGGDINNLNPADIESIDVLKDAASSAIYGSRSANGIILITTKQGKAGKIQVTYDAFFGWQNAYRMPSLLNAKEYMTVMNEVRFNEGNDPYDFAALVPNQYNAIMDGTWNGTNWLEEIRNKNALTQNHAFNLTGGSELSKFSMGFSYTSQDGIFGKPVAPNYSRYTFRINSDHILLKASGFDVIKIGENVTYSYNEKSGIGIGNQYWNDVHNMVVANPLMPVYNSDGGYYDYYSKLADGWNLDGATANPIADMEYRRGHNISKTHNLQANVYVEIQPIKNLKLRSSYGYKMSSNSYRQYRPAFKLSTTNEAGDQVNQTQSQGNSWTWENTLSYSFKLNDVHSFEALAGQSLEKWGMGENLGITNINSIFPGSWKHAYLINTGGVTSSGTSITGSPWDQGRLASFFGRVNYNLKETYMATAIIRADGSSNFAPNKRWGYFPSFSAGWVVTNEPFMESTSNWMEFFKLRASWGQNGNQNIIPFQYLSTVAFDNFNNYYFGNDKITQSIGGYPDIIANNKVSWETSEQLNLGFDARFIGSRLGVAFDWYTKKTKDWLVQAPVLASYGANAPFINGGDIENRGLELGLSWNDNVSDFTYGANLNLGYNKNEVTKIDNTEGIIHGPENVLSQGTKEMYRAQVGFPVGYFYGYKTAGIFQNADQVANTTAKLAGAQPGDVMFVDTNNDGFITDDDKVMIGNPHPDVRLGFSLNFGYKGADLSFTATGAFGHQIAKSYRSFADSPLQNYTTEIFDRWHGEGTSNRLPRLTSGSNTNWQYISDIYIEDGDYLKMQNITLGYDFKRLFPKMPLGQARLYLTAQNLFTITSYSGMDPEVGYDYGDGFASGIDLGFYPSPRTYLIGVNLKF
ncbi:SusC/RagA family TonB-linked outer membrane protein [Dysgonomonas sp. ZJ279]|uniref:SusC/RagA family TonB-linked outer membrane protein n=1 Tax=Dysgonomonas sp. ZJ279 TaxID=2709796 RepID=UPI0013EA4F92|nr:TonB-dependent receptor [Dysgonomonas sp. ZJ279]